MQVETLEQNEPKAEKTKRYRYKIEVKERCFVWQEIVDANSLMDAIDEVNNLVLKECPEVKTWETRLVSEKCLSTGKILRRRKGF